MLRLLNSCKREPMGQGDQRVINRGVTSSDCKYYEAAGRPGRARGGGLRALASLPGFGGARIRLPPLLALDSHWLLVPPWLAHVLRMTTHHTST